MWMYKGKLIEGMEDLPDEVKDSFGFVYKITNFTSGKSYIGKKQLFSRRKKKLGKKEIAALTDKRSSKTKIVVAESKWVTYTGSNDELNEDIKNKHKCGREIITFAPNKKLLTYFECKYQFAEGVLESEEYYNRNILRKFHDIDFDL